VLMTLAEIVSWEVTANVLPVLDPAEVPLLPDIVRSQNTKPPAIGNQPGAFDAGSVVATAETVFLVILPVLRATLPKIFDATVDVGKDMLKKILERKFDGKAALSKMPVEIPTDAATIYKLILQAAVEKRLSTARAEAVANAVVARLAMGLNDIEPRA
jgi:hypothetical protein